MNTRIPGTAYVSTDPAPESSGFDGPTSIQASSAEILAFRVLLRFAWPTRRAPLVNQCATRRTGRGGMTGSLAPPLAPLDLPRMPHLWAGGTKYTPDQLIGDLR